MVLDFREAAHDEVFQELARATPLKCCDHKRATKYQGPSSAKRQPRKDWPTIDATREGLWFDESEVDLISAKCTNCGLIFAADEPQPGQIRLLGVTETTEWTREKEAS